MTQALITVRSSADRERAARLASQVPPGTRIAFKAAKRSLPQNDKLWAMLTDISRQVDWYGQKLTPDDWKIIFTASLLSLQGGINVAAYTAAKSGLAGLTRALANEWAGRGVNVNAIVPGYIATDNTQALQDDPDREPAIRQRIPAGRWGRADDLGGAAVFLASAASDYVHGALLPVDGGWLGR